MQKIFDIVHRGRLWKEYIQKNVLEHSTSIKALAAELRALRAARETDAKQIAALADKFAILDEHARLLQEILPLISHRFAQRFAACCPVTLGEDDNLLLARRGAEIVALIVPHGESAAKGLVGLPAGEIVRAALAGEISDAVLLSQSGNGWIAQPTPWLPPLLREDPLGAFSMLVARQPAQPKYVEKPFFERLDSILADLDLIDFFANGNNVKDQPRLAPFDKPNELPPRVPASLKRRSVVLLHNSYYHFNCLAKGLKVRGWDAITVSLESPDSAQRQFYHGEDINLFHADPQHMADNARRFLKSVPERFGALHFYGMGQPSFFAQHWDTENFASIPLDFLELRRHRVTIGYMPSGCLDGGMQSSIHTLTGGLCNRCVWQLRPDVCSDKRSLAWNRSLERLCDWVGLECDHATPERVGPKAVYGPVVTTLDSERWHPELEVPESMRIERHPGEILVYHGVGNYKDRRKDGRDIKGTGAIIDAVEHLKMEGLPVRLIFAHDILSSQMRYLQVQADIVVDQLNYGRYGATAREAMMLGKATICHLSPRQTAPLPPSRPIVEVPMVDATEANIVDVLRALVLDPLRRADLGRRAREFAVAWHGQDACAERYERVIDRIRAGLQPDTPDLYP